MKIFLNVFLSFLCLCSAQASLLTLSGSQVEYTAQGNDKGMAKSAFEICKKAQDSAKGLLKCGSGFKEISKFITDENGVKCEAINDPKQACDCTETIHSGSEKNYYECYTNAKIICEEI